MKKNTLARTLSAIFALALTLNIQAQQHDANALKAAKALALNLDSILKDAQPGALQFNYKGQRLTLRTNSSRNVEHIGLPLFDDYIRMLQPSPIYDYLEYAVLDHKYHISENNLQLQQLKFQKGDWARLESLGDSLMCSVSNVDDKFYVVTWRDNGQEVVTVNFPINYELLANSNRKEILEKFVASLRQFQTEERTVRNVDMEKLTPHTVKDIYVSKGESYSIPSINENTYFRKSADKGEQRYEWLNDKQFPGETLANRLLSPGSFAGNPTMNIMCYLYNHRKETINTTLDCWMAFCRKNGCKPYFGFESNHDGLLTSTLIMRNQESGYNHILTIKCQQEQLEGEDLQLNVIAYLYTPSSNVSNLFHKSDRTSQSRKFIMP